MPLSSCDFDPIINYDTGDLSCDICPDGHKKNPRLSVISVWDDDVRKNPLLQLFRCVTIIRNSAGNVKKKVVL